MSRFVHRGLLLAIALCAGCEAHEPSGRAGATGASVRTAAVVTPTVSPQPVAATPTVVTLTQSGGSPRFGLVTKMQSGHTCLTMEGDSLTDSTAVTAVAYNVSESGDSSKTALKALVVGFSRECADSLSMIDGRQYALHSATDAPLGEGIGIVGGIDTLTVSANRTVVKFPNDSAHWSFAVCSSREGLHYGVERRSADSIITLWDGYRYLGYDIVPDCRGARDIPRTAEVKALAGAWRSGRHDEETAMRLVIARWLQCSGSEDYPADGDSSKAARPQLPPMSALLEAAGSPGKLSAENLFVLGWLAQLDEKCFESALPRPAKEIRAEALRREPSSMLFQSFGGAGARVDVSADSVRAEIHRRFDGRGELYRYLADWLRRQD
jgi:hypothetical protein